MLYWLRWVFVVPSASLSWYLILGLGFGVLHVLDSYCPADQRTWLEMCIAPWYEHSLNTTVYVCTALSEFLVVSIPTFVAPSHRRAVAWISFAIGTFVALAMTHGRMRPELVCALAGGLLGVGASLRWIVLRQLAQVQERSGRGNVA